MLHVRGKCELKLKCNILFIVFIVLISVTECLKKKHGIYGRHRSSPKYIDPFTKTICLQLDNILRAKHKSCFLRADTGPCRADIIQWYFDVKQKTCYRFFWGGCQGNGNRFDTKDQCLDFCFLNSTVAKAHTPNYCILEFDYGHCFGHYYRWFWDHNARTCKRRLYSGCGGNQNNFETRDECFATCMKAPNNTMQNVHQYTTCVPFNVAELQ